MKYLKIISIGLISCILGVFIGYFVFNKVNKTPKTENFEKNIECQKYLESFEDKYSNMCPPFCDNIGVFYSPNENECLGYYFDSSDRIGTNEERRIEESWNIVTVLGGLKKSKYIITRYPDTEEKICHKSSDFKKDDEIYGCNGDDYEKLRKEEIEWLKGN